MSKPCITCFQNPQEELPCTNVSSANRSSSSCCTWNHVCILLRPAIPRFFRKKQRLMLGFSGSWILIHTAMLAAEMTHPSSQCVDPIILASIRRYQYCTKCRWTRTSTEAKHHFSDWRSLNLQALPCPDASTTKRASLTIWLQKDRGRRVVLLC